MIIFLLYFLKIKCPFSLIIGDIFFRVHRFTSPRIFYSFVLPIAQQQRHHDESLCFLEDNLPSHQPQVLCNYTTMQSSTSVSFYFEQIKYENYNQYYKTSEVSQESGFSLCQFHFCNHSSTTPMYYMMTAKTHKIKCAWSVMEDGFLYSPKDSSRNYINLPLLLAQHVLHISSL